MVREEVPPASPDDDLRVAIVAMKGQRNRLGLSLQDVEDRIGIDRSTISRLETGKLANPTWATLKAYARGLGVSLRLLVGPTTATPFAVSASGSGRPREPDGTHADERHQDVAG